MMYVSFFWGRVDQLHSAHTHTHMHTATHTHTHTHRVSPEPINACKCLSCLLTCCWLTAALSTAFDQWQSVAWPFRNSPKAKSPVSNTEVALETQPLETTYDIRFSLESSPPLSTSLPTRKVSYYLWHHIQYICSCPFPFILHAGHVSRVA